MKRLLLTVWKKKILIIVVTAIFALGGYLHSALFITPVYQSTFTAYINNRVNTENVSGSTSASDLSAAMGLAYVYREVVVSRSVLTEAAGLCGYQLTYDQLSGMVSCEVMEGNPVVEVSVASEDPQAAFELAKAVAEAAPKHMSRVIEGSSMRIIDDPVLSTEKFWPSNTARGAVTGLIALAALCLIVIVWDLINDTVQNADELEQRYQLPIIGAIPDLEEAEKSGDYYGYGTGKKGGKR